MKVYSFYGFEYMNFTRVSIVDEIVPEVTKFTDCISTLAPVEYPSTEIYTNWF